jgi:ubiquinone/menaquinone biosynthesis C-methylase UbiE
VANEVLAEQIDYYRARAGEYDEWFFRKGRYDRGSESNERWFRSVEEVRSELRSFQAVGDVLEIACGTGLWTQILAETAASLTAIDSSPEVLNLNRERVRSPVNYVQANLMEWVPDRTYDVVFFSFWMSHVPPDQFEGFWGKVSKSLNENGRVFLIDSLRESTSTAKDHHLDDSSNPIVTRRLNDGKEFQIIKVFYDPDDLRANLHRMGWSSTLKTAGGYFFYGAVERSDRLV